VRRRFWFRSAIVNASLLLVPASLPAQDLAEGLEQGTHIVRPGDTLRSITRAYLGSESLWAENWKLNPEVEDPDRLYPRQRLRVLLAPRIQRPTARLLTISGDVEGKPAPSDWDRSLQGDLMLERDGVRARRDSSTLMRFSDGTELTVKDESTVFLRVAGRTLRGAEQRSVEIVEGQADLAAVTLAEDTKIEVVIGNTVATPTRGESGGLETRARKSSAGGAQVMMYEGAGEVEAAGAKVSVPRGMGTAVPETGPPAPPEKLLPPPQGLSPDAGGEVEIERSRFAWQPVDGAVAYTAELCRDSACAELVLLRKGLTDNAWESAGLPVGEYVWRVSAVSESGLDGYATETRKVLIVPKRDDLQPPTGRFTVEGKTVTRGGVTYHGPDLEIRFAAEDAVTGVESIDVAVDGESVEEADLLGPWETGDYEVTATAVDGAGNSGTFGPLSVQVDADAPAVSWTIGGAELIAGEVAPRATATWERRSRRWAHQELGRRGVGPRWAVLKWQADQAPAMLNFVPNLLRRRPTPRKIAIARDHVQLLVFAPALLIEGETDRLAERLLHLDSVDDRSGMVVFEIRQLAGPEPWHWLEIETTDRLGNRGLTRWQLGPHVAR